MREQVMHITMRSKVREDNNNKISKGLTTSIFELLIPFTLT